MALKGAREFLRDGTFLPKPRRITLTVSPALFPASDSAGREWAEVLRLRDETRRIVSSHAGEAMVNAAAPGLPKERRKSLLIPCGAVDLSKS